MPGASAGTDRRKLRLRFTRRSAPRRELSAARWTAAHAWSHRTDKRNQHEEIIASISLLTLLLGCTGAKSSLRDQNVNPRGLPIIDMHVHATPLEDYPAEWGKPPFPNPITGKPSAATNNDAIMAASMRALTEFNIIKAVASGPLDDVHRWQAAAPDRIIGGILLLPGIPLPDLEMHHRRAVFL